MGNMANKTKFAPCKSMKELNKFNYYLQNLQKQLDIYDKLCLSMFNLATYTWRNIQKNVFTNRSEAIIKLEYPGKFYQEIIHVQDFGFESFWSGVGGFVGIFLGYSLMQFPEFLGKYCILLYPSPMLNICLM